MKNPFVFLCLNIFLPVLLHAQSFCIIDELEQQHMAEQPWMQQYKQQNTMRWQAFQKLQAMSKRVISGTDTSYEIPVVVHIMHPGAPVGSVENPTDKTIDSMIYFLNQSWAAEWPTFPDVSSGGVPFSVRFVLAKRTPDCHPSTGINRVDASILPGFTTYGVCPFGIYPGPGDVQLKSLSAWPGSDYYNIWIVHKIEENSAEGYAPWPWYMDTSLIDGAVVCARYITRQASSHDFRFTITHEVGHSFGLYHTFHGAGCHFLTTCLTMGDELCDTEPHGFPGSFDCMDGKLNVCTGKTFAGVERNFMNYSNCADRFTRDQHDRVLYTLKNYRMGPVSSQSIDTIHTGFVPLVAACVPVITNSSSSVDAGPHEIRLGDWRTNSLGYHTDGKRAYIDRSCLQDIIRVRQGDSYDCSVNTQNVIQNVAVWIDYNNDGVFQVSEQVYAHSGTTAGELHSGTVSIPFFGVETGKYLRMRVVADTQPVSDACSALQDGQAEDYTIWIEPASSVPVYQDMSTIQLYPNPAQHQISIKAIQDVDVEFYAVDGRKVRQVQHAQLIDVSGLVDGVYWLRILSSADHRLIATRKLVVRK